MGPMTPDAAMSPPERLLSWRSRSAQSSEAAFPNQPSEIFMNPTYTLAMLDRPDLKPYLSDEQFEFRRSVNRVLANHASSDYIGKCDEEKQFPQELIDIGVEQGWFALTLPEAYGGIGDYMDMTSFLEVAAYYSVALSRFWNANINMVGGALARFASEEIKSKVLPELVNGKSWLAFALSENGSGSDAASLTTRAVLDGDDFVIDGTKMWITGALQAKYILTAVRTDSDAKKHEGISLLLVPTDATGLEIRPIDLLGGSAIRTCEVICLPLCRNSLKISEFCTRALLVLMCHASVGNKSFQK